MSSTEAGREELRLEKLAWPDIRAAIAGGKDTAILVAGSIEQHGPHLACETDSCYGLEMALRAARRLGTALVAPVIRPGCSDHHLGFPGTLTIPPALLVGLVEAHLRGLAEAGFRHVVLTSSHGGNFGPLAEALPELRAGCEARGVRLTAVLDLLAFVRALKRAPEARGLTQDVPAVQADLIETSIMLALRPELVRMERAEAGYLGDFDLAALFRDGLKPLTPNGVLGDPRGATAELGEAILDSLERYLLDGIAAGR